MTLPRGTRLDRYEVIELLGAGGMGEVYLASDTVLPRKVALKVLPSKFELDPERLRRFVAEARTMSRLNHPNVITIYDVVEVNDLPVIAAEFVEGETLRDLMARTKPTVGKSLDLITQVAAALAAVHAAGIIHRDIKPKNIMVRPDGVVKVLDFGLSTLRKRQEADSGSTAGSYSTVPGAFVGTLGYSAPEQLRGEAIDERADLFSLGVVWYELVGGHSPFSKGSATDTIAAILTTDPPSLSRYAAAVPAELCRIVSKTLRKDPDQRYQSSRELLVDLKSLQRQLSSETNTQNEPGPIPDPVPPRRRKMLGIAVLAAVILVLAGIGYKLLAPDPFSEIQIEKLTNTGNVDAQPAISPDGKYAAYARHETAGYSLRLLQVGTRGDIQIIPPMESRFNGITFSPDSNYIYYVATDRQSNPTLYKTTVLGGGGSRKVLTDIAGPITFSPDGTSFAFVSRDLSKLMVRKGEEEKKLASRRPDEIWHYPAWSPDGKVIACSVGSTRSVKDYLVAINVENGAERLIPSPGFERIMWIGWLRGGDALVVSAADSTSHVSKLWKVAYPSGRSQRITNDLSRYHGVSLTADSEMLVCIQGQRFSNLWVVPATAGSQPARITTGADKDEGITGLSWTPGDEIVYSARMGGAQDIWIISPTGTDARQLTYDAAEDYSPAASPDGQSVAFISDRGGKNDVWIMEIDGGNPRQLTRSSPEQSMSRPQWSSDGQWIVFQSFNGKEIAVQKISPHGGAPVPLVRSAGQSLSLSDDGTVAFYLEFGPGYRIGSVPLAGGAPRVIFDKLPLSHPNRFVWAHNGLALIFSDTRKGFTDLWSVPVAGGAPTQLTDLRIGQVYAFDVSRNGTIACSAGNETYDMVLIRNK